MDAEIEETQRQLRRSAALIQDAFEGLSTLHSRVSEASAMRAQGENTSTAAPEVPGSQRSTTSIAELNNGRRSMDPGHDVIVISSDSDAPLLSSLPSPISPTTPTAPRRTRLFRPTDPTLASLRTDLIASTQSVRERASELEDLRRSIVQFTHERRNTQTEGAPSAATEAEVRSQSSANAVPGPSRRMLLEHSLRQRATGDSATSLGRLVAARSTSAPQPNDTYGRWNASNTVNIPFVDPSEMPIATATTSPTAEPAPSFVAPAPPPIPAGIASRVTRLAQEIQQDIARITQQSESLMTWINVHRARLEATSSSYASGSDIVSRPSSAIRASTSGQTIPPDIAQILFGPSSPSGGSNIPSPPRSTTRSNSSLGAQRRMGESETQTGDQASEGTGASQATPTRQRRAPEVAARARYVRHSVPGNWTSGSPPSTSYRDREERLMARTRERERGLLSLPTRSVGPSSASNGMFEANPQSLQSAWEDAELLDTVGQLQAAMARVQSVARDGGEEGEGEAAEPRRYRVRRRVNADGDEELVRVPLRPEPSPGFGDTLSGRTVSDDGDESEDASLAQAFTRLENMSRETEARSLAAGSRWTPLSVVRGARPSTVGTAAGGSTFLEYADMLAARRNSRAWPRLNSRDEDASTDSEATSTYERDLAAMRARATALVSSPGALRSLDGRNLPPPPPTTRPLSIVPTTQGTPGSLWNDSTVRVRLRAAAAQLDEDMRRVLQLDGVRDREFTPFGVPLPPPSPPLERSRPADRSRGATRPEDLERPVWGSPAPFCPSALPLPLVESIGALEARSRAFTARKRFAQLPSRVHEGLVQAGR